MNNKIARNVFLSLLCVLFFSKAAFAVTTKECDYFIQQTESWVTQGKATAIQMTFNSFSGNEGHVSLADGYLNLYDPKIAPEIEGLLNRGQSGLFQAVPKFVMGNFDFKNSHSSHSEKNVFSMELKDEIHLVLLNNGEVFVVPINSGNAVLPVTNLQCFSGGFFDPGYYMTGFIDDKNGATLVSFIIRNVSF